MPGTGFEDRQWLIERNSTFIQVTELLYRVAEQITGERTLDEIADRLTDSTQWIVKADDVQQIIQAHLMPLGLIAGDSCSVPDDEKACASPLAVNMRIRTLSPRIIEPVAHLLQVFYWRPLLIPLLAAIIIGHWWLYRVHGLSNSVEATLSTPGGLLLIVAIVFFAAVFHEFGHAAALRYGGGKLRGMGVGLYLIYPAFYTDVTDSYRLGRWARVRTDLGGIYFHLIFSLALIGLFVLFGKELLLFAVVLINLDIARQFIPFVRLDGYWLLADLTGIPDFLSQMAPFARGIAPIGTAGSKLPPLRPWVKAVFTLYTIVTLPALGYVFFLTVRNLPAFLATTRDALFAQARMFSSVAAIGDYVTLVLLALTMLLLFIPVLGTLLIIYSVLRVPIQYVWSWSKPAAVRRAAGATAALAFCSLVVFLYAPRVHNFIGSAPHDPQQKAKAMVSTIQAGMARAKTLTADLQGVLAGNHFTGKVWLKRPNLARVEIKGEPEMGEFLVLSNGSKLYTYFPADNRCVESVPGPDGSRINSFVADQVSLFFDTRRLQIEHVNRTRSYTAGKEMQDGIEYDVFAQATEHPNSTLTRYFVAPNDHLVYRVVTFESLRGKPSVRWAQLKNVRTNIPVDDNIFHWVPPPNAGSVPLPGGLIWPK